MMHLSRHPHERGPCLFNDLGIRLRVTDTLVNPHESSKDPYLPCWPRPGLHQLPKEGTVPALGVRGMVMWTAGTTGQEAQVNLEHSLIWKQALTVRYRAFISFSCSRCLQCLLLWTQHPRGTTGSQEAPAECGVCSIGHSFLVRYRMDTSSSGCIRPKPYLLRSNSGTSVSSLSSSRSKCVSSRTTNLQREGVLRTVLTWPWQARVS